MAIEYIVADGERQPVSVAEMEIRRQRAGDWMYRDRLQGIINAARSGDIAALAAKGFRPWVEEKELSYSDGFGLGLARTVGL